MRCHLGLLLPFVDIHLLKTGLTCNKPAFTNDCFFVRLLWFFLSLFSTDISLADKSKRDTYLSFSLYKIYTGLYFLLLNGHVTCKLCIASGFGYQYSVCHVWRAIRFFFFSQYCRVTTSNTTY